MSSRTPFVLASAAIALMLAAWVPATQPWSAPDEPSHYLRALSISEGVLLGRKIPYPGPLSPAARVFVNHDTRAVYVPRALAPADTLCINGKPDIGGCTEASPTGDYYPVAYLLPAAVIKVSPNAQTALWLSRTVSALLCVGFFVLAVALVFNGEIGSLIGLLAAITPMVLFISSILNPSGLETAASIAFACAALRLSRGPEHARGWVWAALAVSGIATILSWQAGPGFALADLVVALLLLGRVRLRELIAQRRRPAAIVGASFVLPLAAWVAYSRVSGVSHSQFDVHPFWPSLGQGAQQLPPVLRDAVGNFAGLTIHVPLIACCIWWLVVVLLIVVALAVGGARERLTLVATVLIAVAFPILGYAWLYRHSGFGMQGRQVLPALALMPLVAGEVIARRGIRGFSRPTPRMLIGAVIAVLAGFQAYAWWYAARGASDHGTWTPPLGWLPWASAVALATALLLIVALTQALTGFQPRTVRSGQTLGTRSRTP